jgi:hypothetical protein
MLQVGKTERDDDLGRAGNGEIEGERRVETREGDVRCIRARQEGMDRRLGDHIELDHQDQRREKRVADGKP